MDKMHKKVKFFTEREYVNRKSLRSKEEKCVA